MEKTYTLWLPSFEAGVSHGLSVSPSFWRGAFLPLSLRGCLAFSPGLAAVLEVLGREEGEKPANPKPTGTLQAVNPEGGLGRGVEVAGLCYLLLEAPAPQLHRSLTTPATEGPGDKTPQMSWSNICTTFPAFTKKAFSTQSTLGDELGRQSRESPLKLTL